MPTFKVKANEMTDATVSHISLVDRGANRIPFKIVKQEKDGMASKMFHSLDLRNLFIRKNEEQVEENGPEIVGVVTMDDDDDAKAQIKEAGFATDDSKVMEDGSVVYSQVGESLPTEEVSVLKWDDRVAFVMKGFSPYMMDVAVDGISFAEQCKAQGFYPGIRTVSESITDSINSIVSKAESPAVAATQVATLWDEARDYVTSLIDALPSKAFKMEKPVKEEEDPMKKKKKKPVDEADSSCAKGDFKVCADCKTPKECAAAGVCAGEKSKTVEVDKSSKKVKPEEEKMEEETDDKKKKAVKMKPKGVEEDTLEEVDESVEEEESPKGKKKKPVEKQDLTADEISSIVTTKMDEYMGKLVGAMEKRLDGIASTVAKAEAAIAETNAKLKGVLVPGSDSGDSSPTQKSEKGNGVFGGRDIDTAFQPGVRNRVR